MEQSIASLTTGKLFVYKKDNEFGLAPQLLAPSLEIDFSGKALEINV